MGYSYRANKKMSANYEITKVGPFDVRSVVDTAADLNGATFGYNFYTGMIVSVVKDSQDKNGLYICIDDSTPEDVGTWKKLAFAEDGSGLKIEVLDTRPEVGEDGVLYFIKKASAKTEDAYEEFMYVNGAWEKFGKDTDLSNYYTKGEVDDLLSAINSTVLNLSSKVSVIETTLAEKASTSDVNDMVGDINSTISTLATKSQVTDLNQKITAVESKIPSTEGFIKIEDVAEAGYATQDYVNDAISDITGGSVTEDRVQTMIDDSISELATKSEVANTYLDKSTASSTYATKEALEEVEEKIPTDYITESQAQTIAQSAASNAVSGKVNATDIPSMVEANIPGDVVRDSDISDMATKTYISSNYVDKNTLSSSYTNTSGMNSAINAAKTEAKNNAVSEIESKGYVTKDTVDLTNYYKKTEMESMYASKGYVDEVVGALSGDLPSDLSSLATQEYVNTKVGEHISQTYTKTQTNDAINAAVAPDKVATLTDNKIDHSVLPDDVLTATQWGSI